MPPWLEHPFWLVSWLAMEKFSAEKYLRIGSTLEWFGNEAEKEGWEKYRIKEMASKMALRLARDLLEIGCKLSSRSAARLADDILVINPSHIPTRLGELKEVISDEMTQALFLWVPFDRAKYYDYPAHIKDWDDVQRAIEGPISARFSQAATEIYSARR